MAFVLGNDGAVLLLGYALNYSAATNVRVHLYTNDFDPDVDSELADYEESEADGYAAQSLTGTTWVIELGDPQGADASYPERTFALEEAETVYGYFVTDSTDALYLGAERFEGGPFVVPMAGGDIKVTPQFSLNNCPEEV